MANVARMRRTIVPQRGQLSVADLADDDAREALLWDALAVLTEVALEYREREAELAKREAARAKRESALVARIAYLEADQAEVKARLPKPRFTAPPGWLCAQQAAHVSGMSLSGFYRKWRKLGIIGVKFDRCFMFDPASLPVRKL